MRLLVGILTFVLGVGCANKPATKEQLKPTIRDLNGGFYAFDRHPDASKAENAALGNEALQDSISEWVAEHPELEVRMILPLETASSGSGTSFTTSFLIMTQKRKTDK